MPLPVADPKLPPIVFLNTSLLNSSASVQALLALHIEFYPYYVVANEDRLTRDQVVDALIRDGLAFVVDSLHEVWSLASVSAVSPDARIGAWARQQPSPREPFSFLVIEDARNCGATSDTHLADYTVFCDVPCGFDDDALSQARLILRSQIPINESPSGMKHR
ncbi:hypothetical protein [Rugamonas apoptosis]|uniref:Uncharacterized protein n=1 Tax=Rugamonas apoptosis TaxID=2758570 RepID=A0A7W2IJ32_9BURK|nr:hypothetical protein [Rugamonas apoptosis]MBA5686340.1 hypothetical protein [Rugamonas apoptosis]